MSYPPNPLTALLRSVRPIHWLWNVTASVLNLLLLPPFFLFSVLVKMVHMCWQLLRIRGLVGTTLRIGLVCLAPYILSAALELLASHSETVRSLAYFSRKLIYPICFSLILLLYASLAESIWRNYHDIIHELEEHYIYIDNIYEDRGELFQRMEKYGLLRTYLVRRSFETIRYYLADEDRVGGNLEHSEIGATIQ